MIQKCVVLDGLVMASTLAFLGLLTTAVTVNNQTDRITIDCYERLASGQRLHANDAYKTIKVTTLQDCQIACTEQKEICRSFSYGAGLKGNGSCEMSNKIVKETADLKPIGTVNDTNYDLYIKKTGCTIVLETNKDKNKTPTTDQTKHNINSNNKKPDEIPGRPGGYSDLAFSNEHRVPYKPFYDYQDYENSPGYNYERPGFMYAPNFYGPPIKVQSSLISVSPIAGVKNDLNDDNSGESNYDGNKNYLSHKTNHYSSNDRLGVYEQQVNSLDSARRPTADRLPPPFSINYNQHQPLYAEESSFEQHRDHYASTSYEYMAPISQNNDNRYPFEEQWPSIEQNYQSRPQNDDFAYDRPQIGGSNEYRPIIYRPLNHNDEKYQSGSNGFDVVDHGHYGHDMFINKNEFDRLYDDPFYKPDVSSDQPDRYYYDYWPSQGYAPTYSGEFTYGNRYPYYKQTDDGLLHTQSTLSNENDNPLSGNKTENVTALNQTKANSTSVSFGNGSVVSQTKGPNGETVTSIITELKTVCFRKAFSGKRVTQYIVKTLSCETLDDCRQECSMESSFVCEGFNYRFTRGKGICELLDRPLSVMDTRRCVTYDPETDYYERDRNGDSGCRSRRPSTGSYLPSGGGGGQNYLPFGGSSGGGGGGYYDTRRGDSRPDVYYNGGGGGYYDGYGGSGGNSAYYPNDYYSGSKSCKGCQEANYGYDYRRPFPSTNWYDNRRPPSAGGSSYNDRYRPYSGESQKHGDFPYHQSHSQNYHYDYHFMDRNDYDRRHYQHRHQPASYLPKRRPPSYDYTSYEPYLPPDRKYGRWPYNDNSRYHIERDRDRSYWGLNKKVYPWGSYGRDDYYSQRNNNYYDYTRNSNYYLPSKVENTKNWGVYGGSYGTGGQTYFNKHQDQFDYWGFNKPTNSGSFNTDKYYNYGESPPYEKPATGSIAYLPVNYDRPRNIFYQTPESISTFSQNSIYSQDKVFSIGRRPTGYNFIQEECSLRTVAGFKLRRRIVKKILSVPNIYKCEAFCFAEKEFRCASYAYRYTSSSSLPRENCYLSIKDFKQLDNYIDLEPDKDFDVYTMNNLARCEQPLIDRKVESECFWRVRSSYRLDRSITRDSLSVDNIVDCQLLCLKSYKFTCRAFTFRYGPQVLGGDTNNCQLTDWPYYEINPATQLVPEAGFELYERGSFGYGCEPDIRSNLRKAPVVKPNPNQLCYIGFGSPAKLLLPAIRKSLLVDTELECKLACSRLRDETLLHCMSFSYRPKTPKGAANCDLSDILQRDLLLGVDYIDDPDSWLFAWDDLNPDCQISDKDNSNSNVKITEKEDFKQEQRYGLGKALGIFRPYDTWRVYSVNGWPCRRGTSCRQNKEAGFWFCELEGSENLWDYCCKPDHYCGHSEGFPYRWCYVGPERTQWRKCSDKYYPYISGITEQSSYKDKRQPYLPSSLYLHDYSAAEGTNSVTELKAPYRPGARPDRPPAPLQALPLQPSLNQYEEQFENQFLQPPKPGGFDQSRHWPVSYIHKEMPFNANNSSQFEHKNEKSDLNPKFAAIQNLIEIIKSNDLKDVKYQITNDTNRSDDALFVKIPLPSNFTQETGTEKIEKLDSEFSVLVPEATKNSPNLRTSTTANVTVFTSKSESSKAIPNIRERSLPVYRRSYIERTNVTSHGRLSRIYNDKLH